MAIDDKKYIKRKCLRAEFQLMLLHFKIFSFIYFGTRSLLLRLYLTKKTKYLREVILTASNLVHIFIMVFKLSITLRFPSYWKVAWAPFTVTVVGLTSTPRMLTFFNVLISGVKPLRVNTFWKIPCLNINYMILYFYARSGVGHTRRKW